MADDFVETVGTPPAEGAPETPSVDELDVDDTGSEGLDGDDGDGSDAPEGQPPDHEPPASGTAARKAWDNLEKKFLHIADPDERREAVAAAYWRKTNYAGRLGKENEKLRAEVEALRGRLERPAEPPKEEPPHPDLVAIDNRIQALYGKMGEIQEEQKGRLAKLTDIDREIAIAEDRLKDKDSYDDTQRALLESRRDRAKDRYDSVKQQYRYAYERLEELNRELAQQVGNRDWVERFTKQQKAKAATEQGEREAAYQSFPGQVDASITEFANDMQIPEDKRIRHALWKHVNRALMVDLRRIEVDDVRPLMPDMIRRYIQEFADERDIVTRSAFTQRSRDKLSVAGRTTIPPGGRTPATRAPLPASARPAVPVALLSSDATPAMARARELLVKRMGGER